MAAITNRPGAKAPPPAPAKRKRGRPKGSTKAAKASLNGALTATHSNGSAEAAALAATVPLNASELPAPRPGDAAIWNSASSAPGPLPFNTELHPIETYLPRSFMKDRRLQIFGLVVAAALGYFWFFPPPLSASVTLTVAFVAPLVMGIVFVMLARGATRLAVVIRKDATGLAFLDYQRWWRADERRWPYTWRRKYNGAWTLWIDAQEYDPDSPRETLSAFNAQRGALPGRPEGIAKVINVDSPSQAQLGKAWAAARAARGILDARSTVSTLVQQGLLVIGICVALTFTYLAGTQFTTVSDQQTLSDLEATISERVRQELMRELTKPAPVQPFQPQ